MSNPTLHPQAIKGIRSFNAGQYFEAHEELETAWREETGEIRDLYRGILQIAVSYYHIQRGNYAGAVEMHRRAQKWLAKWNDVVLGIDVAQLRLDFDAAIGELTRLGAENMSQFDTALLKKITFSHQ